MPLRKRIIGRAEAEKILKAVGIEHFRSVVKPDALADAINLCAGWYVEATRYHNKKHETELARRVDLIIKTSKRLEQLLSDDGFLPISSSEADQCMTALHAIRKACFRETKARSENDPILIYHESFKACSPFEALVGHFLPLVYWNAGFATIPNEKALLSLKSPYVRFAMVTVRELGISIKGKPYSRASFLKAIRTAIHVKKRRKKSPHDSFGSWLFWRESLVRQALFSSASVEPS